MSKIIWIGSRCFAPDLEKLGHECRYVDYPETGRCYGWQDLTALSGLDDPDLVVVTDKSTPPYVLGMESFPCLTALYAIDTHIHSWFPYYAQAFDLCFVSLKDHLPDFWGKRLNAARVIWLPPFAGRLFSATATADLPDKEWDVLFVGKVDPAINPERVEFLARLKKLVPSLHVQSGNFTELFPKAKLVLNHSIAGDLNFRVFEALACGACLLTPKLGHGQDILFEDGKDLFMFDQSNIEELAGLIERLLAQPEIRAKTAISGHKNVSMSHLPPNRAKSFSETFSKLIPQGGSKAEPHDSGVVGERLKISRHIHESYLKMLYLMLADESEIPELRSAYLAAALNRSYQR